MNIKTLCAIALTSVSAAAFAVDKPEFNLVDLNADGFVSQEEAQNAEGLAEVFEAADMNKDGQLDTAEYTEITLG
ncbi:calmodulin [Amphritea opalescens]|uniref:Calmodulin n=1 Tax=Amphritea opalescens TaxID=2490544 RepID=A0A430KLX4_9GAMM|nr:calmodulin [Amphritea opalescens]RTE64481.1 calmodulin [Amphritea opalescens]